MSNAGLNAPEEFVVEIAKGYRTPADVPKGTGRYTGAELAIYIFNQIPLFLRREVHDAFQQAVANQIPQEQAKRGGGKMLLDEASQQALAYSRLTHKRMASDKIADHLDCVCLSAYFESAAKTAILADNYFPTIDTIITTANGASGSVSTYKLDKG